jgi:hypothetical protein
MAALVVCRFWLLFVNILGVWKKTLASVNNVGASSRRFALRHTTRRFCSSYFRSRIVPICVVNN